MIYVPPVVIIRKPYKKKKQIIHMYDKVLYEEMMMNDDNLESNLLTSSLLKVCSLYKFCYRLHYKLHMLSRMSV